MKTKDEVIETAMKDFSGKLFPYLQNWMHSRLSGIWSNGYQNGLKEGSDGLSEDFQKAVNEAYQTGFVDGKMDVKNKLEIIDEIKEGEYFKGYNAGLLDAWDVAKTLRHPSYSGIFEDEREEIYGYKNSDDVLTNLSALEALKMLREHFDKKHKQKERNREKNRLDNQNLRVGDFVIDGAGNRCLITNIDTHIHVLYENGKTHKWKMSYRFVKDGSTDALENVFESGVWKHDGRDK